MINIDVLENELKKNDVANGYVFCGLDEELIKISVDSIINKVVEKDFIDLNFTKLDGLTTTFEEIENACETLPFFGDRKVVLVYRANFLKDKADKEAAKTYSEISKYIKNLPSHTVLIMYYVFNDKRDTPKKNKKLSTLDKYIKVVHCDKLKKDKYYKKIEDLFKERGRNIGKIQLKYFADKIQNNFDIIKREIDKIDCYAMGREITKEDIDKLIQNKSEDDIFDLVEYISTRKVEKALDLLDELLFKADQHMLIISSIGNHFKRLYEIKVYMSKGKRLDFFMSKYRLPQFVCEKLMNQASKFSPKQLSELIKICVDTETKLKSSSGEKQMEMELMLFKTFMVK
ncbi:DNA polymerase III subunit delta [Clostridium celatum]|uniref:DNA polymerase III subunit delta n=1 Tax=Clostridium celatum DSM 1785 TaxID=545697 RepID=L1Q4W8_9CLOT|nr:DNA polymerase III subunit delta [Clostridium celatum]EKY22755.1 DNA polymerase III, delta subunit [Clostridium celatum DSM 1785]MCE9653928.1 DNA polymerase III subunit delta [Clostridium celatum]MDU2266824.1 DNA polymerase III subunit delta [Clostridium celatum]MDU6297265.1 DNA polymerase III subunit delta [Clostridium celatum]